MVVALRIALDPRYFPPWLDGCPLRVGSQGRPRASKASHSAAPETSWECVETLAALGRASNNNCDPAATESRGAQWADGGRRRCRTHVSPAAQQSYANFSFGLRAAGAVLSFPRHDLYEAAHGHTAGLDSPGLVDALVCRACIMGNDALR